MALDELVATIETIKERIVGYRASLAANETRTRQVLIDPLLAALGWNVSDPDQVELEYDVRGRRADYALLVDAKPVAVIEAKRLGHQLVDDNTMQVMNYANTAGIEYMVVTNGDEWKMYSVFERGAIEERVIMELGIVREAPYVNALNALSLWRANVGSRSNPVPANNPILTEARTRGNNQNSEPFQLSQDENPQTPTTGTAPEQVSANGWVLLALVTGLDKNNPIPKRIMLPDRQVKQIRYGVDILRSVANWLVTNGRFSESNAQLYWVNSKNRYLSNQLPIHPRGDRFRKPHKLSGVEIYLETDLGIQLAVDSACTLLKHCGVDPNTVSVIFD